MAIKPLFIAYSDIHHNIYGQYNEDNRRLKASLKFEKRIFYKAQKLKCPILFVGDLIHTERQISNELLSYLLPHYISLGAYDVDWYGISGNHDQSSINIQENQSPSYVKTFSALPKLNCIDFKYIEKGRVRVYGVPYLTHDQGLVKYVKSLKLDKKYKNILLLHTTLPGTKENDNRIIQTTTLGARFIKLIQKKFDLTLTGHIHKPMKLAKSIIQVGCTNQQRKTDKGSKLGYWIIYSDLSVKFKAVNSPEFIEVDSKDQIKDNFNYYYIKTDKIKKGVETDITKDDFKDVTDKNRLAKKYLKQKGINDKDKKSKLLNVLNKE